MSGVKGDAPALPVLQPAPARVDHPEEPRTAIGSSGAAPDHVDPEAARAAIVRALKTIEDPEIPLNLYDLGLIYDIDVREDGEAAVEMTLTAPGCPVASALVQRVADTVGGLDEVRRCRVDLVWDPTWTKARMSDAAKLELGLL